MTHITCIFLKCIKNQWNIFYDFFLYIKITNNYYQKHKENLQEETHKRYQNISAEEKEKNEKNPKKISKFYWRRREKKRRYHRECNKNFSEEQKQKIVDYRRNYYIRHNK